MQLSGVSIKWKILFLVLIGPIVIGGLLAWQRISDIRGGAEKAIISKSAGIVMMAESTRDQMAKKLQSGVLKPFDQLTAENILEAVPVVTAMQVASAKAKEAGYTFRAPKLMPRNPNNAPTELEKDVLNELTSKNLSEKVIIEPNQIRYFKPVRLTAECLYCHGDPVGGKDVVGGVKEGWREGEIHGAFEIISSLECDPVHDWHPGLRGRRLRLPGSIWYCPAPARGGPVYRAHCLRRSERQSERPQQR